MKRICHDIQTGKCSCCFKKNPDPVGKAAALKEARETLAKLDNPSHWRVHHNIQWYWNLIHRDGHLTLYPSSYGRVATRKYHTLFSLDPRGGGGDMNFSSDVSSSNPNVVVKAQVKVVHAECRRYAALLNWKP
jgi:hypothetical protein